MTSILKVDTLQDASGTGTPYIKGAVLQVRNAQYSDVNTGTTQIPTDNTIPQNTEGDEYMTLSITPKNANSYLKIEVTAMLSSNGVGRIVLALFKDSIADALNVSAVYNEAADYARNMTLAHYMEAGSTALQTFKVRIGNSVSGTTTFNGTDEVSKYGSAIKSSITITEIGG